eukprot:gene31834-40169_t
MMQPTLDIVYDIYELEEPLSDGTTDKAFISKGYDPTSHFETAIADVMDLFQRIMGKPLEMKAQ